ncbi:unnamed protein product [Rotaria sp. Silwood1]|nr:unnamed protein product [Rotaria sp. Silwood1]CAF3842825.1 unnamed protein product [Rotaria sp. Silwood1]CAF4880764.1 unnamed protein product [Rotaria sp. Silwood1]
MNSDHRIDEFDELDILAHQRSHPLKNRREKLVDQYLNTNDDEGWEPWKTFKGDKILGYREHLLKQIKQDSSVSLCRMISADNHVITTLCRCSLFTSDFSKIKNSIVYYNHLIFDFDTHELVVERLSNELLRHSNYDSLLYDCIRTLQRLVLQENSILFC